MSKVTMNDFDKLYSPSSWTKRHDEIVKYHVDLISSASKITREEIPCELNIPYGSLEKEKLDIFGTDLKDDAPIFVFIHGGYWQEESLGRDNYSFIADVLYKNNIKSILVGYELCPHVKLQEIVEEIKTAAKFCVDYAKSKGAKGLYFAGHSAGGHLAITLLTDFIKTLPTIDQNLIKAVISICGLYDLVPLKKTIYNSPLQLNEQTAKDLSPLNKQIILSDIKCNIYLITAENESPEFIKQAETFTKKLQDFGAPITYWKINNVDHFDIIELLAKEDFILSKRLIEIIKKH